MIVILSAQVLNHSSLQDNGHGLACKLRGFASGGNGHGPVEQTEEVNIQIPATGHENEQRDVVLYEMFVVFRLKLSIVSSARQRPPACMISEHSAL